MIAMYEPLSSLLDKIYWDLLNKVRAIVELILIISTLAYLSSYIIITTKTNYYLFFALFLLYIIIAINMRGLNKTYQRYLRLLRLNETNALKDFMRRFRLSTVFTLILNVVIGVVIFYKLPYLYLILLDIALYTIYMVDKRIVSLNKLILIFLVNTVFIPLTLLNLEIYPLLLSLANLADLMVIKIDVK
ncbi:hypothetical protein EWF20_06700 [Sulfolobus sp. S-194]|uniref:hypothetical protein n=1 Tax=Sulfolobus sp. S-194 TaxID=2512240 RepID=UPI001436E386|nr:hypothetical protein [Sulfolobus sp. S-194]QIW23870.1 hypothetical protein EWF20_06700 [Sulfolobus sp. S-194]